ncbi:MAG: phosphoribosylglycinamide formyltransferase [Chromatiaceae bacterium]|nr:phosphoribosylglycinamide formyltransferase [Gammaproteobacteria bacterium]MCB1862763.1 phosphoribosylglycinamide formyltransferase [Gammaproteobacteria bacterium]MCB1873915.1 phosphoribosylglycinamide formyltransferase [Gammaproteobacteria bacterium]MCB1878568.1 phosphoribosylglycinamide formyltransferase [Gammaproteobacteria bacterium]MCP5448613.1 phosphoribosylglycinamide formyltransferase [Chromatiaceae bacterium]
MTKPDKLPLVVLISGSGSNLQAIIDQAAAGLAVEIRAVVSNRPGVRGLERAEAAGIATRVLDHKAFPDRESYDLALADLLDEFQPQLVILAGFMRILSPLFIQRFRGRMLNIHPSLLPKYRGLHTHQRALDAGDSEHGASVHYVTEELDGGPLILQARVAIEPEDNAVRLAERVLAKEHIIFPMVIRWIAEGRLTLTEGRVIKDGKALEKPLYLTDTGAPEP